MFRLPVFERISLAEHFANKEVNDNTEGCSFPLKTVYASKMGQKERAWKTVELNNRGDLQPDSLA
jgi:hypothetical protein